MDFKLKLKMDLKINLRLQTAFEEDNHDMSTLLGRLNWEKYPAELQGELYPNKSILSGVKFKHLVRVLQSPNKQRAPKPSAL